MTAGYDRAVLDAGGVVPTCHTAVTAELKARRIPFGKFVHFEVRVLLRPQTTESERELRGLQAQNRGKQLRAADDPTALCTARALGVSHGSGAL